MLRPISSWVLGGMCLSGLGSATRINSDASEKLPASRPEVRSCPRVRMRFADARLKSLHVGNFFDGKTTGKNGRAHIHRGALALETQRFPDAPDQPNFPSFVLNRGKVYKVQSKYNFSCQSSKVGCIYVCALAV